MALQREEVMSKGKAKVERQGALYLCVQASDRKPQPCATERTLEPKANLETTRRDCHVSVSDEYDARDGPTRPLTWLTR